VTFINHHSSIFQPLEVYQETDLLLSSSMDGKLGLSSQPDATYIGHSEGIKAIKMSNTGSHFFSTGFDRYIRQVAGTYSNRKMAYDVKFYQWDMRSGQICQEYNHHLQPCNTVTFFDDGRKFVSTGDDKRFLVLRCIPSVLVQPSHIFFQSMGKLLVGFEND
jgi:pre-mRNA-processing factor 17